MTSVAVWLPLAVAKIAGWDNGTRRPAPLVRPLMRYANGRSTSAVAARCTASNPNCTTSSRCRFRSGHGLSLTPRQLIMNLGSTGAPSSANGGQQSISALYLATGGVLDLHQEVINADIRTDLTNLNVVIDRCRPIISRIDQRLPGPELEHQAFYHVHGTMAGQWASGIACLYPVGIRLLAGT